MKYIKTFEHIMDNVLTLNDKGLFIISNIPDTTTELYCYNNNLKELPTLPYSLKTLNCSNNNLSELPLLPETLEILVCEGNNLPYNNLDEYNKWLEINHPDIFNAKKFNI